MTRRGFLGVLLGAALGGFLVKEVARPFWLAHSQAGTLHEDDLYDFYLQIKGQLAKPDLVVTTTDLLETFKSYGQL